MTPDLEQFRYEIKFVCHGGFRHVLDRWWRYVPEGLTRAYDDRLVNNIYFDSLNLRDFHDNVIGLSGRVKTRLRWYGESSAPDKMVLEHKIKRGRISRKEATKLDGLDLAATPWDELADYLSAHVPPRSVTVADNFKYPLLRNSYRRQYFESRGRRLRMTIDTGLTFCDPLTAASPFQAVGQPMSFDVVEFKAPVELSDELDHLLRHVPMRASRFSKYVTGVTVLRG